MDYPPSAYILDGMQEIVQDPIVINVHFYWNDDDYAVGLTASDLAEFMMTWIYSEFDIGHAPRYVKCLQPVFDQAIYIDAPQMNPYYTGSLEEVFDYDYTSNILRITLTPDKIPAGFDRDEVVWSLSEMRDTLADTLWECEPGNGFVHDSGAVVDFEIL